MEGTVETLGSIFGVEAPSFEEEDSSDDSTQATPRAHPTATATRGRVGRTTDADGFSTPQPPTTTSSASLARGGRRGRSASPKRKLDFGSEEDEGDDAEGTRSAQGTTSVESDKKGKKTRVAKRKKRGTSLPTPTLTVSRAEGEAEEEEDDASNGVDEHPRRSPRKPPPTRRFDPAKAGRNRGHLLSKRRRGGGRASDDEDEEDEEDEGESGGNKRQKKKKTNKKAAATKGKKKQGSGVGRKRKNERESEDDEHKEDEEDEEEDEDSDQDFRTAGSRKNKQARRTTERKKRRTTGESPKKSPKKVLANEHEIKEKVEEEMEALNEYFADIDDTPLEEEEPPGTKWVSRPMLKSPQRLERLAKYPTIAKDYAEYKKALHEAHVEPAPITEFVKNMEDKRLEAVIQP